MDITIKYEPGEQVWIMYQNKPKRTNVIGWQVNCFKRKDPCNGNHMLPATPVTIYKLGHDSGDYEETLLFPTKEALIASL